MKVYDKESHRFADIFPMIEGEQLEQLKADIKEHGLLQPIVMFEGKILDGRNRYKACKELGLTPREEIYAGTKPLEFVVSLNLKRRHLKPDQRAVLAQEVMPMLEEEARKRMTKGINQYTPMEKIPQGNKGLASEKAGKLFDVNEKYIRDIKKLKEQGKETIIEEIKLGHKSLVDVKKEARTEKLIQQRKEIEETVLEQPTGDFDVIVIDPPWDYGTDENYNPVSFRGTTPYPTMTEQQIRNIKLPEKENTVLWLWTTNRFLKESFNLLELWGYEYKTMLTWDKEQMGIGKWLRSQTEHCLLAIKGKPFFNNTKYPTILKEKRTTHSTKPEGFYLMVDEICAGRKLDYFARKPREGWEVYGDEVK